MEGKRWWECVWQTYKATFYVISPGRGYHVVKENFGEDYRGILIHDCRAAHNNTISKTGHQQCNSHLQRDLKFLVETYKSKWAYQFNKFLNASHRARDKIWSEKFDTELRNRTIKEYTNKLLGSINIKLKEKDVLKFQKRIKKHRDSILLFMNYKSVPFHNNSSEQAIRMTKVKQKISGGHRSQHGAQRHSVLLSIIETAKKQNMDIFVSIQNLLNGSLVFQG